MLLRIDTTSDEPLHRQIAGGVRRAVADGSVPAGGRLPAAADLAAALEVNSNTVLRAYRDLRDEGLVELRRGRGATVTGGADGRAALTEHARRLLAEGRRLGYSRADVVDLLKGLS